MKEKQSYGFIESDFAFYIEPTDGIRNGTEFREELEKYALKNGKTMTIIEEGMEPIILLDEKQYICKLGDPYAAAANNPISKMLHFRGMNRVMGPYLGYKWIYVYPCRK